MKIIVSAVDWKSIGRGALIAVVGALLTYLTSFLADADFGAYTPLVAAGWAVFANLVRKWIEQLKK